MARLNLGWLKPPKASPDGVMSLADHLRELRYRIIVSALVIVVGLIVCWIFYLPLYSFLLDPYEQARAAINASHPNLRIEAALSGVVAPLMLQLMVSAVGGLVLTSPVWLYQVWAYLAPALLAKEKKYALLFLGAAVPLFLAGVVLGYVILPQAVIVMLGFMPDTVSALNLIYIDDFLKLMMQLMLVFGLGFLLPVVLETLNLMGVLSAKALASARPYALFGCAVFGAAATPGGDPFSMLALALPMMALYIIAEFICRANDKRRAKRLGSDLVSA